MSKRNRSAAPDEDLDSLLLKMIRLLKEDGITDAAEQRAILLSILDLARAGGKAGIEGLFAQAHQMAEA